MKEYLDIFDVKKMFFKMNEVFSDNLELLSRQDSIIGDGDHGITICRGFKWAVKNLEESEPDSIKKTLILISNSLISKMGGASGPLFGTIFHEMGNYLDENTKSINVLDFTKMLSLALDKIVSMGKAKPGDKTMVDVLDPVVNYLGSNKEMDFIKVFNAILELAKQSAEKTKTMTGKKGRARYLGERSLGYQDPGATSVYLIIKSMKEVINEEN